MTTEQTAIAPGNTKTGAFNLRGRSFLFTIFDLERANEFFEEFKKLKSCDYGLACLETCPDTGRNHIHLYVHFTDSYRLSKKIMSYQNHVDVCKGSPKQVIAYVSKDNQKVIEWGNLPHQGCKSISELREMSIEDIPPQYYNIKNKLDQKQRDEDTFMNMLDEIENNQLKAPKIIYITGGTGKGKTYSAYKLALKHYEKQYIGKLTCKNDFIDVVNENAKCYVIEEFRPSQIKASDFLQLTDKYGYRCNIKGGFATIRPEMIIICSIIHPSQLYINEEINEQFRRRITNIIDLEEPPELTPNEL